MAVNVYILILLLGILLRCCVSLFGYSGEGKPPMYGDYEAQRHWMEVTLNLPINDWYFNTTDNDLLYWGLDYPPLTAYHSLLCGYIANYLNPEYVRLETSRGYESAGHKLFMRYTVIVFDIITYIAASYLYARLSNQLKIKSNKFVFDNIKIDGQIELLLLIIYPGMILIDHGHFQYNCVSLGLSLYSITATKMDRQIVASLLFCLSLCYKQMILYYSLPIFFYYLGMCCNYYYYQRGIKSFVYNLAKLSFTVILTLVVVWLPFLYDNKQFAQVIHRIFPFERGVFEDKVSNIWCFINVIIKFRTIMSNGQIAMICLFTTLFACLPSVIDLFKFPNKDKYIFSLINCSLAFFLFSFQVHEKTILLTALPVILSFKHQPLHSFWFLIISIISLLPLSLKDNLLIPYIALLGFFTLSTYAICYTKDFDLTPSTKNPNYYPSIAFKLSMLFSIILMLLTVCVKPPMRYPDLFPLLVSIYCALHFFYFLIFFNICQLNYYNKVKTN